MNARRLSDLKDNVVLVDFTVYNHVQAAAHNLALRELYNKYHDKGLEIYQISLDTDEHFWKTSADNLPWICVRVHCSSTTNSNERCNWKKASMTDFHALPYSCPHIVSRIADANSRDRYSHS